MPARNSALEETLPSISTARKVGARSWSRALVSLASIAWPQAFSRPRTRPASSEFEFCAVLGKPVTIRSIATPQESFLMEGDLVCVTVRHSEFRIGHSHAGGNGKEGRRGVRGKSVGNFSSVQPQ